MVVSPGRGHPGIGPFGSDPHQFRSFKLPDDEIKVLKEVKSLIEEHSSPGEPIFTFPHIPVFYMLTDRWPDTFGLLHWFDVTPDWVVAEDMKRLEAMPPKVIVVLESPESAWRSHEVLFRHGKPMLLREMDLLLKRMTYEPGAYTLEASYDIPNDHTLKVWVRSGRATPETSAEPPSANRLEIGTRPTQGPAATRVSNSAADLSRP